jgi:hypothetical protein
MRMSVTERFTFVMSLYGIFVTTTRTPAAAQNPHRRAPRLQPAALSGSLNRQP